VITGGVKFGVGMAVGVGAGMGVDGSGSGQPEKSNAITAKSKKIINFFILLTP
jgi:hypothetical protein